jgi:acetyltransferase-like isoleucine patch superfamily enzyme
MLNFLFFRLCNVFGLFLNPSKLKSRRKLEVGKNTFYNSKINFAGTGNVRIGNYCAIGPNLTIISSNHNYNFPAMQIKMYKNFFNEAPENLIKSPICIGNDVWIGNDVIILSGVNVGDGACVGAGSVVTKDIPPYAIAVGVPARTVKYRFSEEVIEYLLKIRWWHWDDDKIKRNKSFFMTNLNKIESVQTLNNTIVD